MVPVLNTILWKYGISLMRYHEDGTYGRIQAFFQPVNAKTMQNLQRTTSSLGEVSQGLYVYIGGVNVSIREGDRIHPDGSPCWYSVRRVETVYYGQKAVYRWGLCAEIAGEDPWKS